MHWRFPAPLHSSSREFFVPPTFPRFRHKIPLSPGASRRLGLVSLRIWFARQPHVRPTAGREAPPRDLISISSTEICSSQFRLRLYLGFVRDLISVSSEITSRLRHWLRPLPSPSQRSASSKRGGAAGSPLYLSSPLPTNTPSFPGGVWDWSLTPLLGRRPSPSRVTRVDDQGAGPQARGGDRQR